MNEYELNLYNVFSESSDLKGVKVVVLQVMWLNEQSVVAEIVDEKEYINSLPSEP